MTNILKIKYTWWENEDLIPREHFEELESSAEEEIFKKIVDNYTAGELHCVVLDGTFYNGIWNLERPELI